MDCPPKPGDLIYNRTHHDLKGTIEEKGGPGFVYQIPFYLVLRSPEPELIEMTTDGPVDGWRLYVYCLKYNRNHTLRYRSHTTFDLVDQEK